MPQRMGRLGPKPPALSTELPAPVHAQTERNGGHPTPLSISPGSLVPDCGARAQDRGYPHRSISLVLKRLTCRCHPRQTTRVRPPTAIHGDRRCRRVFADEQAFRAWYDRSLPSRLRVSVPSLWARPRSWREELTQQAFVEAVRGRYSRFLRCRPMPRPGSSDIARHKLVDHFRRADRDTRRLAALSARELSDTGRARVAINRARRQSMTPWPSCPPCSAPSWCSTTWISSASVRSRTLNWQDRSGHRLAPGPGPRRVSTGFPGDKPMNDERIVRATRGACWIDRCGSRLRRPALRAPSAARCVDPAARCDPPCSLSRRCCWRSPSAVRCSSHPASSIHLCFPSSATRLAYGLVGDIYLADCGRPRTRFGSRMVLPQTTAR